jgi:diguanylate cyclase (GGDEF)-like protein
VRGRKKQLLDRDAAIGIPSKDIFDDRLTQALVLAKRNAQSLAVMFLSFDNLKLINDKMGQRFGDQLIKAVANRIKGALRKSDTAARPGSNEFMILLPQIPRGEYAAIVADKIFAALSSTIVLEGHEIFINASIGISICPNDGDDTTTLIKNAYTAMQHAIARGHNTYTFYSAELNNQAFEMLLLENNLRLALKREEFILHYQPQMDLRTGLISGFESLVRWQHPERGLVYPAEFIKLMEDTGLICQLGEWGMRQACMQNKRWQEAGINPLRIAVNISSKQIHQKNFVEFVKAVLDETGLNAEFLELELTERVFMWNIDTVVETLRALRIMGVHIAIDDFGTGYSSLSYLKLFPVNKLKIVEPFVSSVTIGKPNDVVIAKMIIGMAHSLNMKVIAEGVEDNENLEFLRSIQCDELQGNILSHPIPPEEVVSLLQKGEKFFALP